MFCIFNDYLHLFPSCWMRMVMLLLLLTCALNKQKFHYLFIEMFKYRFHQLIGIKPFLSVHCYFGVVHDHFFVYHYVFVHAWIIRRKIMKKQPKYGHFEYISTLVFNVFFCTYLYEKCKSSTESRTTPIFQRLLLLVTT